MNQMRVQAVSRGTGPLALEVTVGGEVLHVTIDELIRRLRSGELRHVTTVTMSTDATRGTMPAWFVDVMVACSETPDKSVRAMVVRVCLTTEIIERLSLSIPEMHFGAMCENDDAERRFDAYLAGRTGLTGFTTCGKVSSATIISMFTRNPDLETLGVTVADGRAIEVIRRIPRGIRKCHVRIPSAPPTITALVTRTPPPRTVGSWHIPTTYSDVYSDAMADAVAALLDESVELEDLDIRHGSSGILTMEHMDAAAQRIIDALERNTRITQLNLSWGTHPRIAEILERNREYVRNVFVLK